MNRLVLLGETLRHALNVLAVSAPEWLKPRLEPAWVERYARRLDEYRLPKAATERAALASQFGADGRQLLSALFAAESPEWLRQLDGVRILITPGFPSSISVLHQQPALPVQSDSNARVPRQGRAT